MILWIDIINPSHALFFHSLLKSFQDEDVIITVRDRAETVGLVKQFGMNYQLVGIDKEKVIEKALMIILRTLQLTCTTNQFDYSISFENGMSVLASKLKRKPSLLFCDNDLKFIQKTNLFQDWETTIKLKADYIFVPKICEQSFKRIVSNPENIISYDGYKEDMYIADFTPDPNFKKNIPFDHYIALRPEALTSFYVTEKQSLIPELLKQFKKHNINVVFLPRIKQDRYYAINEEHVYIPNQPLNGLDLAYHADVILTGSGTMAREAACLGTPAISFFPGNNLLSVDRLLIQQNKMIHSRNTTEIIEYVLTKYPRKKNSDLAIGQSKQVKKDIIQKINRILYEQ